MYISYKRKYTCELISNRIISKLVRSLGKYGKIVGIKELSKLSGVAEITIKVNMKYILNDPHIKHSRDGQRKTYIFEYLRNPKPKPKELKSLFKKYDKVEHKLKYVAKTIKALKGKIIHESVLYSIANLASEIIIDSDNLLDELIEYSLRDSEKLTGRAGIKHKMELLSDMRLEIHNNCFKISPLISKNLVSNLQLSRNKKIVRTKNYPYY